MYRYDEPPDWVHNEDCEDPEVGGNCTCDELDEAARIDAGESKWERDNDR